MNSNPSKYVDCQESRIASWNHRRLLSGFQDLLISWIYRYIRQIKLHTSKALLQLVSIKKWFWNKKLNKKLKFYWKIVNLVDAHKTRIFRGQMIKFYPPCRVDMNEILSFGWMTYSSSPTNRIKLSCHTKSRGKLFKWLTKKLPVAIVD